MERKPGPTCQTGEVVSCSGPAPLFGVYFFLQSWGTQRIWGTIGCAGITLDPAPQVCCFPTRPPRARSLAFRKARLIININQWQYVYWGDQRIFIFPLSHVTPRVTHLTWHFSPSIHHTSRRTVATRPWSDGNCSVGKTMPSVYRRRPVLSLLVATTLYAAWGKSSA